MGKWLLIATLVLAGAVARPASQQAAPSVDELMSRVAAYAAGYGETASLIVAVEKYTQRFGTGRPRQIVAEFAIVRTPGGWVGYRDVVEVDGQKVADRRDRLMSIFTDPAADSRMARKLSEESARFNIGPISRNFNVPTTVMLVFLPANLPRFAFTLRDEDRIDGVLTREVVFTEVRSPTLTMTRAGRDVPMEGSVWVTPSDGAVVRTRMRMRNFADATTTAQQRGPARRPAGMMAPGPGRPAPNPEFGLRTIETEADVTVNYRRHPAFGMWLPADMTELYIGPVQPASGPPVAGTASTTAIYSDFKSFQTGVKINIPK